MDADIPKVLMAHCFYRELGGENLSFQAEVDLLRAHEQPIAVWTRDNREIDGYGRIGRAMLAARTVWSVDAHRELRRILARERPGIAHFQNTFPLMSPSVYGACRRRGVAVVQTLRNYRLVCPSGVLYRDGAVCEDCVGRSVAWPGVLHACYRDSRPQSAVVATMLSTHGALGTWRDDVDLYVVPSEYGRRRFIEWGLPEDAVVSKPNFIAPDPGVRVGQGSYALFVGRLTEEKGIRTLLRAWERVGVLPLRIVGEGKLADEVRQAAVARPGMIEWLGPRGHDAVLELVKGAAVVVFPSEWYETFGRVAIEAYACGVPVLASRLGAMAEVVDDGVTGLLFTPGDADDLASTVERACADTTALTAMGWAARSAYEDRYTPERNYEMLTAIYRMALERAAARRATRRRIRLPLPGRGPEAPSQS